MDKILVAGISCAPRNKTEGSGANGNKKKTGGRCLRPGPIGRNPYLNFLRNFRKENCGLSAVETVRRGAAAWNSLPEEKRTKYIIEAFYAPKYRRRTRRSIGRSSRPREGRVRKSTSRKNYSPAKSAAKNSRISPVCARPRPLRKRVC